MVVQTLRHQLQRQRVLLPGGLLDLGALVLEPNFDLRLVESQLGAQLLPAALGEVTILSKLVLHKQRTKTNRRQVEEHAVRRR